MDKEGIDPNYNYSTLIKFVSYPSKVEHWENSGLPGKKNTEEEHLFSLTTHNDGKFISTDVTRILFITILQ